MTAPSRINGTLYVETLTCGSFTAPANSITDSAIPANANIAPSKVENLRCIDLELFAQATRVDAVNKILHTVRGTSGTLVAFEAVQYVVSSSTANLVYVDLQKATTSSTWTSILAAPISIASSDVAYVPRAGSISAAGILDGNNLRVSVTTTGGSTSNNATGLTIHLTYSETYN